MVQDIPWQLLEKHFAKETVNNEEKQVTAWIRKAPENSMIYDQLQNHYQSTGSLPMEFKPDTQVALQNVDAKLKVTNKKSFKITPFWYGAAASVLIIVASFWFLKNSNNQQQYQLLSVNTTETTTSIMLVDGTRVWLNFGSKLEYPEKFEKTREVHLTGEGYFEVAHDPSHPFIVLTKHNIIKDIGTKFDIRSYHDEEKVSVAVTEGSVSFGSMQAKQIILKLGQMSCYNKETKVFDAVSPFNPNLLAWKTKEFVFDNKPLSEVFQTLSSIYHFDYKFSNKDAKMLKITTQFKELSLQDITSIISLATKTEIVLKSIKEKNSKLLVIIK